MVFQWQQQYIYYHNVTQKIGRWIDNCSACLFVCLFSGHRKSTSSSGASGSTWYITIFTCWQFPQCNAALVFLPPTLYSKFILSPNGETIDLYQTRGTNTIQVFKCSGADNFFSTNYSYMQLCWIGKVYFRESILSPGLHFFLQCFWQNVNIEYPQNIYCQCFWSESSTGFTFGTETATEWKSIAHGHNL